MKIPFEQTPATPPTPDESERVEDPAKAEEMARASDEVHDRAVQERIKSRDESLVPDLRKTASLRAEFWEKKAEEKEEEAALDYDTEKSMETMSDSEVEVERDRVWTEEVAARKAWEKANETFQRTAYATSSKYVPDRELVGKRPTLEEADALREIAKEANEQYLRLARKRNAIEKVLQKRWHKSEKK